VQVQLSFCTYFLYPLVITLQDWSVNYVRKLKCQPCMEAAQIGKPADFNPDGMICNARGNPINYVWMGESEMPGDEYMGKEKKWCIQFHNGNLQSATIYFNEVDARKFKEKVIESLEGLT
ncbi:MAG: hypothetical protein WBZ36_26975, partial [Candidatus Nitrosopolaris sp.]